MADTNVTPQAGSLTLTEERLFITNPVVATATMRRITMRRIQSA